MAKSEKSSGGFMYRIGSLFTALAQKFMPDAIIFALGLTILVFILGIVLAGASPLDMIIYHGQGMWSLLAFTLQVVLTLLFSNVIATTGPVEKLLEKITSIPKTPAQVYMFGFIICCIAMIPSWAIGLVVGGVYAKTVVRKVKGVDYPFLVATVYCSLAVWHGGLSGTIPLAIGTEGSICAAYMTELIPSSEFFFHPTNLALFIIVTFTTPFIITKTMMPPADKVFEVDPALIVDTSIVVEKPANPTPAQRVEYSRITSTILAVLILGYYVWYFAGKGIAGLDLNSLNGVLFGFAVLLCGNFIEFNARIRESAKGCGALMCQFPLYAGIMAMTTKSGLAEILSNAIVGIATPQTLPNIINISSAILNMIIPSGGGKFSCEAPIYFPAIYALKADVVTTLMGAAWGDALTNLIQPFWALPLLAIAKLSIRDIMGYCVIYTAYIFVIIQVVLYVYSNFIAI